MTLTIELNAEMEARLNALAGARGLETREFVREFLETQLPPAPSAMSAEQRAAAWRAITPGLPTGLPLSDEAISRASIYASRG
jgi:hypothetical protein